QGVRDLEVISVIELGAACGALLGRGVSRNKVRSGVTSPQFETVVFDEDILDREEGGIKRVTPGKELAGVGVVDVAAEVRLDLVLGEAAHFGKILGVRADHEQAVGHDQVRWADPLPYALDPRLGEGREV